MGSELDTLEAQVIDAARAVSRDVLSPNAERYDREASFPADNFSALSDRGLIGVVVPREYGGLGLRWPAYALFLKELAKGCTSTAVSFHMHNVAMAFIEALGTSDQKERFFREAVGGALFGSWGAEPTTSWAGKVALSTNYRQSSDGRLLLNGTKYFCSLGSGATYALVFAAHESKASAANREDVQILIVHAREPGVSIGNEWDPMGLRATVSQRVELTDCLVEAHGLLGGPGAMAQVPAELIYALGYAAAYQGVAESALKSVADYARNRRVQPSNQAIAEFDRIQRKFGEMALAVYPAALAVNRAAELVSSDPIDKQAALQAVLQARALTTRGVLATTGLALEVAGGPGVVRGNPLERLHRDARTGVLMVPGIDQCLETLGKQALGFEASEFA